MTERSRSASQLQLRSDLASPNEENTLIKFKSVFMAIALVIAPVIVSAPIASAQGTVVMVIDEGQILGNSKAGKDMFTKLKNIENQINVELKTPRDALEADRKTLATKLEGKTQEAVMADAALVTQIENFQKKANEFAAKRQTLSQEYAATEQKALVDFNKAQFRRRYRALGAPGGAEFGGADRTYHRRPRSRRRCGARRGDGGTRHGGDGRGRGRGALHRHRGGGGPYRERGKSPALVHYPAITPRLPGGGVDDTKPNHHRPHRTGSSAFTAAERGDRVRVAPLPPPTETG
jgi:Skp family chaperone for outer membrane proteins